MSRRSLPRRRHSRGTWWALRNTLGGTALAMVTFAVGFAVIGAGVLAAGALVCAAGLGLMWFFTSVVR